MKIESECYQIMSDNTSDLSHWPALCNAGALLVPWCLLHTGGLNVSWLFLTTDCRLPRHLSIPPTPPTLSLRPFNTTHIVKLDCVLWSSKRTQSYLLHHTMMIVWRLASELVDCCQALSALKGRVARMEKYVRLSHLFLLMPLNILTRSHVSTVPMVWLMDYLCFYKPKKKNLV